MNVLLVLLVIFVLFLCAFLRDNIHNLKEQLMSQEKEYKELITDVNDRIIMDKNNSIGNIVLFSEVVICREKPYLITMYEVSPKYYNKLENYGCYDNSNPPQPEYFKRFFVTVNGHFYKTVASHSYSDILSKDKWAGFCCIFEEAETIKQRAITVLRIQDKANEDFTFTVDYFDDHWNIKL